MLSPVERSDYVQLDTITAVVRIRERIMEYSSSVYTGTESKEKTGMVRSSVLLLLAFVGRLQLS